MGAVPLVDPAAAAAAALQRMPLPALLAWALELSLLVTHGKVLFAVGPDFSFEELEGRRYYFLLDLLSPWVALAAATGVCGLPGVPPALLVLCGLHAALHAFYIATWRSSRHMQRVICLSSTDTSRRFQAGKYGTAELARYYAGTSFDMATHAAVLWLLSSACGAGAST